MKQVTYKGLKFVPFIENEQIQTRISQIAAQISREFDGQNPVFLCVLNGAFPFAADLFRAVGIDAEISFIRLKSYEGMASTGNVKMVEGLVDDITGRPVIVVEDIIDTGNTMVHLLKQLRDLGPSDLRVATLLFKPQALQHAEIKPDYVGFEIPSKFIIGFGLDIDGMARNLPDIWVLDDAKDNEADNSCN